MIKWLRRRLRAWLDIPNHPLEIAKHRPPMTINEAATALAPPPADPYRFKIGMPKLPEGVLKVADTGLAMDAEARTDLEKKLRARMAMDDGSGFPFGGFLGANTVAGAGFFGLYFPGYPYLAEVAQRTEYRQPTETIAKEMTRKWITFKSKGKGKKEEKLKEIAEDFEKFKLQALFRRATEHDGFFGIGHLFIDIEGQQDHALPLEITPETITKDSLLGFKVIEPMWCTPLVWNSTDPTSPDFYKPTSWMVLGRETHQSRMLRFVSREVPDIIKPAYNFGGISLSQLIQPYVDRWLKTVDSVNRLISNYSIVNLRTDMSAVLAGGPSTELQKRMGLFIRTRDNQGAFLSDKETEELILHAVQLGGLSELQAQAQEHMAAPTHLPLVVMTGITPAGLNASSDSEIEIFHDWNHSMQEMLYTDNLTICLHLIQLNRYGSIDDDITFEYVPLKELVGETAARVRKMASEAGIAYIDAGVISPQEERQRIANDPDSGYNNLSGEPPEPPEPDVDPETGLPIEDDESRVDEPASTA